MIDVEDALRTYYANLDDDDDAALRIRQRLATESDAAVSSERTIRRRESRWITRTLPAAAAAVVIGVAGVAIGIAVSRNNGTPTVRSGPVSTPQQTTDPTPIPAKWTGCRQTPASTRPGVTDHLVPGSPVAVTICPNGPTRPPTTTSTGVSALVSALNALPTSHSAPGEGCTARGGDGLPARGTFVLHFHYSSGADVVVNVLPECVPSINNTTGLTAETAPAALLAMINDQLGLLAVSGTLREVGGPAPGLNRPIPGLIAVYKGRRATGHPYLKWQTDRVGQFHFTLSPGTYTFTATTPKIDGMTCGGEIDGAQAISATNKRLVVTCPIP